MEIKTIRGERWVQVKNSDYLISNMGRWFSLKTFKIIKQNLNNYGYLRINTGHANRFLQFTHIKVVEMFGDCNGKKIPKKATSLFELGLSIDHIDGNKFNNMQSNLELVSHSENCLRKFDKPILSDGIIKSNEKKLKIINEIF